ncbi:peptide-methionine (S)-S-oxide reductase [Rhizobium sp. Root1203]|uniref:peptide-methionine (S)-S-oxide reductase n=1 Tax=Rhizobium sp. Root1203 TaxID=1736427 RepID=UPI0009E8B434|nr:peptide-methionine (S)-S-oxide reductase [Rhizobium sp. Root1203]
MRRWRRWKRRWPRATWELPLHLEQATFGAGCFWGSEAFFRAVEGVVDARVGHATGTDGSTAPGRIEVVQIDFDPSVVSYRELVELFWTSHDPTAVDRQGVGFHAELSRLGA